MVTGLMQKTEDSDGNGDKTSSSAAAVNRRLRHLSVQSSPQPAEKSPGGHLDVHGSQTNYIGATHWTTILENVRISSRPKRFGRPLTQPRLETYKAASILTRRTAKNLHRLLLSLDQTLYSTQIHR